MARPDTDDGPLVATACKALAVNRRRLPPLPQVLSFTTRMVPMSINPDSEGSTCVGNEPSLVSYLTVWLIPGVKIGEGAGENYDWRGTS
jgi:hypothetical protein